MTRTTATSSFRAQRGIPLLLLSVALFFATLPAFSQVQSGTPPFGSFAGGPDVINLANLNSHIAIPVLHKAGRGGVNFTYDLSYDSSVWYPIGSSWQFVPNWGWRGQTEIATGYLSYSASFTQRACFVGQQVLYTSWWLYQNWVYHDPFGGSHSFSGGTQVFTSTDCGQSPVIFGSSFTATATDGSGYTVNGNGSSGTITSSSGTFLAVPINTSTGAGTATDRNGNQISVSSGGAFTDTLGGTALNVSGTAPNPTTFTYTAPSGVSASYTMKYTTYTVQTNFGCSGISEYGPTSISLVSEIDLPDWNATTNPNSRYVFAYETTPNDAHNPHYVTGRLASVTLPTAGQITYAYSGGNNGIICADGSTAALTRTTPDGTWTYAHTESGTAWTTTVTDPQQNQTALNFQGIYETQRQAYQGSSGTGTLLETVNTCYNGAASPCNSTTVSLPITQRTAITTLPVPGASNVVSKNSASYNSSGMLTEVDVYAYGSGAPPTSPLRKTLITYAALTGISAFQQTVTVQNGSGSTLAQTTYNYDETTPVAAPSGTPQLTSPPGSRGNVTSIQRCTNTSSCSTTYVKTTMTYDTAGQLQTSKDPNGNTTTFSYTDNFYDDNGSNPPAAHPALSYPTDAYVTSVALPVTGSLNYGYYYYSGQRAIATDQNNNSSYSHFQDLFARLTSAYGPPVPVPGSQNPASPWALNTYAGAHTQADTYLGIDDTSASTSCSSCRHDQVALDGLGRPIHGYLISDPEGQTQVDTAYDSLGRVQSASHPHRSASSTTDGIETPTYDALSRTTKVTHPDSTFSQTAYGAAVSGTGVNTTQLCSSATYGLGYPVLFTDEAGKRRETWIDGAGRTIEVDEPDSSGNLTSQTCYAYDPLGNLLQIVHGSQTRTYVYDPLSRVTSVTTPELANSSGQNCSVTYQYDSNSNIIYRFAPAPNQTSCTTTVTTTYFYDALNRLTKITYSDGTTPTVQYGYDGNALSGCATTPPGLTDSNPKGRRTSMCDGSGATSWAHDATGKILTEKRTILGVTETISYSYNLDGSIAAVTYPSNKVITYTVSNAQRLTVAKDNGSGTQFATAASYAPPGGLNGMITGQISGGFGGITESHTYNNSLEYTSTQATSTAGTALNLSLSYNLAGGDNGTVTSITNNADNGRTQTFAYDPLNRISSATTTATSGVDCWGQNFAPDALANLNTISVSQCSAGSLSVTVDGNNHINSSSAFAYDAAGNMTQDGSGFTYTFDAENRLTLASGMSGGPYCYVYDGLGLRVAKKSSAASCSSGTVTKLYWRSIAADSLGETDGSGSTTNSAYNEYVFFTGRRIASRNGTGTIFYWFADQIGSTRTITTGSGPGQTPGQLCYDADFTPYGQEISYTARLQTTACPPSYKFTGYERDPETTAGATDTGLDYAFARYYSSRLGRFLSTDPLGGSIGDLQSNNAYAYTENNPLNVIDPSGMGGCPNNPNIPPGTNCGRRRDSPSGPLASGKEPAYSGISAVLSTAPQHSAPLPSVSSKETPHTIRTQCIGPLMEPKRQVTSITPS